MSNASNAKKCFAENLKLFGNAQTQPEKYNLYNGLANLSDSIEEMQNEIHRLRQEVDSLRRNT